MAIELDIQKNFKGFSLDVRLKGQDGPIGILGASGSGKSMTLRSIAGIETPDSGRIIINGKTVFDSEAKINLKPQERRVGYLFQNYALFPTLTVEKNIACGYRGEKSELSQKVADYETDTDAQKYFQYTPQPALPWYSHQPHLPASSNVPGFQHG